MKKRYADEHILELLSSPIDIHGYEDLYRYFSSYFNFFPKVLNACIVNTLGESKKTFGHLSDMGIIEKLDGITSNIPRDYLGDLTYLDDKEKYVATPIFFKNDEYDWLILELKDKNFEDILNKYFFKFLSNINLYRRKHEKAENLKVLATTDDVTGLYNQRKLSEDLEEAVKWHEKEHGKFSIMFIDVDHFKNVNDDFGHLVGSKLLLDLGTALKLILRQSDHVYRYGGDEFVVIMPNVETDIVYDVAKRILSKLKNHIFEIDNGDTYKMSLSIGIAEYPTDAKSAMEIIKFADQMMYKSKKSGRGKVFHVNEVANVDADTE